MGLRNLKLVSIGLVKGTLQSPRIDCLLWVCMDLLYGGTSDFEKSLPVGRRLNSQQFEEMLNGTYENSSSLVFILHKYFIFCRKKKFPFSDQLQHEFSFLFIISEHIQELY